MKNLLILLLLLAAAAFLTAQDPPVSPLDLGDVIIEEKVTSSKTVWAQNTIWIPCSRLRTARNSTINRNLLLKHQKVIFMKKVLLF